MNELKVFNYESNEIRTVIIDNEPWWVAKDVCAVLEITNTTDALKRLDEDEVTRLNLGGLSGETNVVNEPGLYALILGSRKPEAKAFKRWVTHEVIPSIRQNGGYIAGQEQLTPEQIVANALVVAQNIIANQNKQLETMKPKAEFHDAVVGSDDTVDMSQVAKILNYKGIGRNKLFEILRKKKVLRHNNEPMQAYVDRGWFRQVESKYQTPNGDTRINIKTVVFQKGVDGIRKIIDKG